MRTSPDRREQHGEFKPDRAHDRPPPQPASGDAPLPFTHAPYHTPKRGPVAEWRYQAVQMRGHEPLYSGQDHRANIGTTLNRAAANQVSKVPRLLEQQWQAKIS